MIVQEAMAELANELVGAYTRDAEAANSPEEGCTRHSSNSRDSQQEED